jgi:hypothetical protein
MEISMAEHQAPRRAGELQRLEQAPFFSIDHPRPSDDIDRGVKEISLTVLRSNDEKAVRATYHVLETSNSLPAWKLGSMWCMRRSTFRAKIWMAERRAWQGESQEDWVRLHILLSKLVQFLSEQPSGLDSQDDRSDVRTIIAEVLKTMRRVLHADITP